MADLLRMRFGTATTKKRLYRAKRLTLHVTKSDFTTAYTLLQDYPHIILMRNKEATVKIQQTLVGSKTHLKRFLLAMMQCIKDSR